MPVTITKQASRPDANWAKIKQIDIQIAHGLIHYVIDVGYEEIVYGPNPEVPEGPEIEVSRTVTIYPDKEVSYFCTGGDFTAITAELTLNGETIYDAIGRISYTKLLADGVLVEPEPEPPPP